MTATIIHECKHGLTKELCRKCRSMSLHPSALQHAIDNADIPGPVQLARFDHVCPWCCSEVKDGLDFVYMRGKEWVCEECAVEYDVAAKEKEEGFQPCS